MKKVRLDQLVFERGYTDSRERAKTLSTLVFDKREELDAVIERYARGWKPERISRTALAVLRCAICEILYLEDVPVGAAINEAVELDKYYDEPETTAFVNGILGAFVREELGEEAPSQED